MKYDDYLIKSKELFDIFVERAKKIKKNDKSEANQNRKVEALAANVKLRAFLQKFRGKACRCKE